MDGTIDSPALALFNPPAQHAKTRPQGISHAPRHFVTRSLHNLRQGNIALFIVFCGCFVIFVRALFGAGYDEGYSADADAAVQKHPSLLSRWGPHSQHALEQQWKKLRTRDGTGAGLWAKIRKEDEGSASSRIGGRAPGHDALHWLRVMEDKALTGLGRRHPADVAAAVEADPAAQTPLAAAPVPVPVEPEHDISEDLDEHDGHDDEEHVKAAPVLKQHEESAAAPPLADASTQTPAASAPHAADTASPASSSPAAAAESSLASVIEPAQVSPASPEVDPEHDDTDDEPVYHKKEEIK